MTNTDQEIPKYTHRRPEMLDFVGKTVRRFEYVADNVWRIWWTDGTAFAIQCEVFGPFGLPGMEICDVCPED
jgi:hypothetical protein